MSGDHAMFLGPDGRMTDPNDDVRTEPRTETRQGRGQELWWRECVCGAWYWGVAQTEDDKAHSRLEAEDAAGPREGWETFVGPDGKRVPVKFAEAAAGPRDEGLDVERLARAMQNVEDELTATSIAYEYAALAKASDHD